MKTTGKKLWNTTRTGVLLALTATLWACSSMEKLDPIDERVTDSGHLTPSVPEIAAVEAIPATVENSVYLPLPEQKEPLELFTVSAADIPVEELLYSLARDAKLELDVFSGVSGQVTINAIDKTLPSILKRIADQAGLVFELKENYLVVRPDKPVWRTYEVDYLNVERSVDSQVVLNMAVSSGPGDNETSETASRTTVNTTAESKFWASLSQNLMAQVTSAKVERLKAQLERDREVLLAAQSRPNTGDSADSAAATTEADGSDATDEGSTEEVTAENDVVINRESGIVSIFTDERTHDQVQSYLDRVMRRIRREVLIEATIVEVELFDDYRSGVDWAALSANGNFKIQQSTIGSNFADLNSTSLGSGVSPADLQAGSEGTFGFFGGDLALNLQLVQRYGDTRVLSSPKIMAVNNQTALLKVVDNYVYFSLNWEREESDLTNRVQITYESELNTVPVGLIMSVTPFISSNDEVTLSVRPTISRIVDFVEDPAVRLAAASLDNAEDIKSSVPLIREREMEAVLKVRNGQTAVIGGLMQDVDDLKREGLPGLESTPGIGDAFAYKGKNRRKSELVIFIRPVIVESPDVEHGDLKGFRQYLPGQQRETADQGAL